MFNQNEVYKELHKPLKEIGLTEHEIALYCLSLSLGPTSVAKLALAMNLNRPNTYKVIKGLKNYGLARFETDKGYAKTFVVESPTKVLEIIRRKKEEIQVLDQQVVQAMPSLLGMYGQGKLPTSIKIIEGEEGFLKLFDQIIEESNDTLEYFGSAEDFVGFITWAKEQDWIRRRIRKNLKINSLLLPSKIASEFKRTDKQQLRETRILSTGLKFITSFQLYANKIIIWQPKRPLALLIEDEYINKMFKGIFYALWENAK